MDRLRKNLILISHLLSQYLHIMMIIKRTMIIKRMMIMKRMTIVKRMMIMSIYPIGPQHLFYIGLFRQTEIVGRVVLSTLLPHYPTPPTHDDDVVTVVNNEPAEQFAIFNEKYFTPVPICCQMEICVGFYYESSRTHKVYCPQLNCM